MSVFSAHDILLVLAAPVAAAALGGVVLLQARRQSRRAHRRAHALRAARLAAPAQRGAVARAASTTPAP